MRAFSSQKAGMGNSPEMAGAVAPVRARGRLRVAAILDSTVELFIEKGYDATTMTEIAERSDTAIGSLYRWFPSKESIADALLLQYAKQATSRLAELELQAPRMNQAQLAEAFVAFMSDLLSQRRFALTLVEARGGSDENRSKFREALRNGVGRILKKSIPSISLPESYAKAVLLLHILKVLPAAMQERPATKRVVYAEVRQLIEVYLKSSARKAVSVN
jgi:AcrR family transcriptional regulator